jgi:hypothetical protein
VAWATATSGTNRDWLLGNVLESNVPAQLRHTALWLSSHGKTTSAWWGELDYSGPCQPDVDRDCDGWWDHGVVPSLIHDNCAYVANPDQLDSNDNGVGDVCSLCPFDPTGNDADGDGVCAGAAATAGLYKRDNCPTVKNTSQANCNEEAELVKQHQVPSFEILGDACDPVPCPQTRPIATGEYRNPIGGGHPQFGGFFSGRVISDQIATLRVAPHVKQPSGSTSIAGNLPDVVTSARFCQHNEFLEYKCHADANIATARSPTIPPVPQSRRTRRSPGTA